MKVTPARTASFGPYTLDLRSGELRKYGTKVKMGEQSFRILCLLLENPGEMVTREELRAKLWADDTFVDFDHGLNSAVQRLRDCLSDSAGKPRWVETLPRRGYRFVGQVEWSGGAGADELFPGTAPAEQRPRRRLALFSVLAAISLFLAALLIAKWIRDTHSKHQALLIRSIAVLPLENLSGDPGQEYFADGTTDELITMLAKNPALRITSRTSVMRYKQTHPPLRDIARELGVDGILEGSVGRVGNRVHMTAQLIYAPSDTHVWAESYNRDLSQVNLLQKEIARTIARQVGVAMKDLGPERLIKPEAHDAYLLGRYYWFAFQTEKGQQYLQKAIDLEPEYAAAWSGLADSFALQGLMGERAPATLRPQAEKAAKRSLELDDSLAEAHNTMAAMYFFYHWNWEAALRESARAIELNPGFAEAHHLRQVILGSLGRAEEGVSEQKMAMDLDPFSRPWAMSRALTSFRQFDAALKEARVRSDAKPSDPNLHWSLSSAYFCKGMKEESIQEWVKALELEGNTTLAGEMQQAFVQKGYRGALEWNLISLKKNAKDSYVSPIEFARAYAMLGNPGQTIRWLETAYKERVPMLAEVESEPVFDFLHGDPHYRAIIAKMGLPPA